MCGLTAVAETRGTKGCSAPLTSLIYIEIFSLNPTLTQKIYNEPPNKPVFYVLF